MRANTQGHDSLRRGFCPPPFAAACEGTHRANASGQDLIGATQVMTRYIRYEGSAEFVLSPTNLSSYTRRFARPAGTPDSRREPTGLLHEMKRALPPRQCLLSLPNHADMACFQIVGARHAVPGFQGHSISRASVDVAPTIATTLAVLRPGALGSLLIFFLMVIQPCLLFGQTGETESHSSPTPRWLQSLPRSCRELAKSLDNGPAVLANLIGLTPARALTELGDLYSQSNELDCAEFAFEQALKQHDHLPETRTKLALTLIQKGDSRRAIDELQTVVRQKPESAEAHNALGLALQHAGSLDTAVEEFKTAVRLDPEFDSAFYPAFPI